MEELLLSPAVGAHPVFSADPNAFNNNTKSTVLVELCLSVFSVNFSVSLRKSGGFSGLILN